MHLANSQKRQRQAENKRNAQQTGSWCRPNTNILSICQGLHTE